MQKLHENGPWRVNGDFLYNEYANDARTKNPAVVIDMDDGTLLKAGDETMARNYAATMLDEYARIGFQHPAEEITVITFNQYKNLDINEICTLMNYMQNCIGYKEMSRLLHMDETQLKDKIQTLQRIGF